MDFIFPLYIGCLNMSKADGLRDRMETDFTGLVIKVAEESGHQSLSAFMAEKFSLSE